MTPPPAVLPLGEAAWTVVLGDAVDLATHERVVRFAARVSAARLPGVLELVPGYAALTVCFDPLTTDAEALREQLGSLPDPPALSSELPAGRLVTIQVRYVGADLAEVAERTGLSVAEVIRHHSEPEYRVYLLGFAPGFAYLGDLPPALVLPRRPEPRTRVPAGAVAIGGSQTGVYPLSTPGGWHLLGTTSLRMFDPARTPPALLAPGDRVRFEAIG